MRAGLAGLARRLPPGLRRAIPAGLEDRLRGWIAPPDPPRPRRKGGYASGAYWEARADLLYYQYFRYMVRCIGADAASMADVGSGNCPYLEWFDWIPERVSIDLKLPYRSAAVTGVAGDIRALALPRYDLISCLQVLEHVPEPAPFARRLLALGRVVLVSVPHRWPYRSASTHVNDPVDLRKLERWFGRRANYSLVVQEPFAGRRGARLFAIFDEDPARRFGPETAARRRPATPPARDEPRAMTGVP